LLAASVACASQEYKRPTADTSVNITGLAGCSTGSHDDIYGTGDLSAVYSGKSGVGPTGSSGSILDRYADLTAQSYMQQKFATWQTTGNSYTSLILYVSAKSTLTNGGTAYLKYSTDGTTFTGLGSLTSSQATYSIDVTGTSLANLAVIACAQASTTSTSMAGVTVYDIWTAGVVGSSASQPGVQVIGSVEVKDWSHPPMFRAMVPRPALTTRSRPQKQPIALSKLRHSRAGNRQKVREKSDRKFTDE